MGKGVREGWRWLVGRVGQSGYTTKHKTGEYPTLAKRHRKGGYRDLTANRAGTLAELSTLAVDVKSNQTQIKTPNGGRNQA